MKKKKLIVCNGSSQATSGLIALSAKEAATEASTAKWQPLAVTGEWKGHSAGPFELTLDDLNQIVENFKNSKATEIVVDYEHMSLYGSMAEAAGWVKDLKVENETLLGKIEWLDDAKEQIEKKKYKYLSPVLNQHTIDQVSGDDIGWSLHSVALTNKPFFEELDEVKINKQQSQHKEEKVEDKELQAENKRLKEENEQLKESQVESKVDAAIAAKKVNAEQKESLMAFGASNPEGLDKFLDAAKVMESPFEGDQGMFAASQRQGGGKKEDETKLSKEELEA